MKIIFPYEKIEDTNQMKYPDDIKFFSNTDIDTKPGFTIAYYSGAKNLVEYVPDKEKINNIYLNISMADGDEMAPIGIINDGVDTIQITATLRGGQEPAAPVIPYSKEWRIIIRDNENKIYDVVKVAMVAGVISFAYNTANTPAICHIDPADLADVFEINGEKYSLVLSGDVEFKVYRDFT